MVNYEREAKIALLTAIVFAVAFGAGVDEGFRDAAPSLIKIGTTIVIGLVGVVNIFQAFSAIKKLGAARKSNDGAGSASDGALESGPIRR
jgi:hypothetical protein